MIPNFRFTGSNWTIYTPGSASPGDYTVTFKATAKTPNTVVDQKSVTVRIAGCDLPASFDNSQPADGSPWPTSSPPEKLDWTASDLGFSGDVYEVYLEKDNPTPSKYAEVNRYTTEFSLGDVGLSPGTWYWQIRAKNSCGTREGPIWSFIIGNHSNEVWYIGRSDVASSFQGSFSYDVQIDEASGTATLSITNTKLLARRFAVYLVNPGGDTTPLIQGEPTIDMGPQYENGIDLNSFIDALLEPNVLAPRETRVIPDIALLDGAYLAIVLAKDGLGGVDEILSNVRSAYDSGNYEQAGAHLGHALAIYKTVILNSLYTLGPIGKVVPIEEMVSLFAIQHAPFLASWYPTFIVAVHGDIDARFVFEKLLKATDTWVQDGGGEVIPKNWTVC